MSLFVLAVAAQNADMKIIKAGKLIDTETGRVLENQMILVSEGKIVEVGPSLTISDGAEFIDLSDSVVLPGLFDCHTHIISQMADRQRLSDPWVDPLVVMNVYAKRTLLAGFTSIRSLGAGGFGDVSLMRAINRGFLDGPRIRAAGFYIGSTGSHGDRVGGSPWEGTKLPPEMSGIADGVDEVRKKVRFLVKNGATVIKFGASAGVLSGEDSVSAAQYTQEEMNAIVSEAHLWGRKVAAHAHGTEAIKMAVKAGVDSIEHGSLIDAEGIEMMKKSGTYLVADVYVSDYILNEYSKFGAPERVLAKERIVGEAQRINFKKAHEAGVKIAFGTDAGIFPHGTNAKQFAYMVKWGMTPMAAIQAATINGADLLGWKEALGSIKAGKFADIIAVKKNPLDDVTALENVSFVMKNGEVYKR